VMGQAALFGDTLASTQMLDRQFAVQDGVGKPFILFRHALGLTV
jgi:hypothetical protein